MGIGEYGEAVGLSVSALRFYDRVDVLVPADVDARTGYRRYRVDQLDTGRLVARLRRIGVGVADLRTLTGDAARDKQAAAQILDRHLERLEAGLRDARAELERIRSTLGLPLTSEDLFRRTAIVSALEMAAADLLHALDAVMFTLPDEGRDPDVEMVVFELEADTLTAFGTDRYRMAACTIPCLLRAGEAPTSFAVSARDARGLRDKIRDCDALEVAITATSVTLAAGGEPVAVLDRITGPVPDLKRISHRSTDDQWLSAGSAELISLLSDPRFSVTDELSGTRVAYLADDPDRAGELTLLRTQHAAEPRAVPVNAQYLLDAINAGPQGRLDVTLRGQHPLAIRFGSDPTMTSIVMPRRD